MEKILIVSIPVSDQQAAKAFYEQVLDFKLVAEDLMGENQRWVQLAPSGGAPTITLVTWFSQMPAGSTQGLVLGTDDIIKFHATLKSRGLEISPIEEAPWSQYATFSDPDGNGWVLQQVKQT
jgi:catechol 2,3-dioxygenase-like lactoylglutathione lyase family enzyme